MPRQLHRCHAGVQPTTAALGRAPSAAGAAPLARATSAAAGAIALTVAASTAATAARAAAAATPYACDTDSKPGFYAPHL